jgi:glutathione S-transferase
MWDRFYDHYVQEPMQKIVADRLRPEGKADAYGVELAKAQLRQVYGVMEREMDSKTWAIGDDFTLADCAAAPALFYANTVVPFAETHENLAAYLDRLMARPQCASSERADREGSGLARVQSIGLGCVVCSQGDTATDSRQAHRRAG